MKKALQSVLQDERAAANPAFTTLFQHYSTVKEALLQAKTVKLTAKSAYQQALRGRLPEAEVLELLTAFRQAKYLQLYQEEALQLSKYRLRMWLDEHFSGNEIPHPTEKKSTKQDKKAPKVALPSDKKSPAKSKQDKAGPKLNGTHG